MCGTTGRYYTVYTIYIYIIYIYIHHQATDDRLKRETLSNCVYNIYILYIYIYIYIYIPVLYVYILYVCNKHSSQNYVRLVFTIVHYLLYFLEFKN